MTRPTPRWYSDFLCCPSQPLCRHALTLILGSWEFRHETICGVVGVVTFTFVAIVLFNGSAPASDTKQLSQVNIQALMQNTHDLTDTTPAVPY